MTDLTTDAINSLISKDTASELFLSEGAMSKLFSLINFSVLSINIYRLAVRSFVSPTTKSRIEEAMATFHTGEEQLESFQSLKNIIRIRFRRIRNG